MILNYYTIYHNLGKRQQRTYQEFKIYLILALLCLIIDFFCFKYCKFQSVYLSENVSEKVTNCS